jgi:hypothetical protein
MAPPDAQPVDDPLGCPGQRPSRREQRRVLLAEWQAGAPFMALERRHRMAHRTVRQLLEEAGADLPPRREAFALRGEARAAFAAALMAEYDTKPLVSLHALAKRRRLSPQTARRLIQEARQAVNAYSLQKSVAARAFQESQERVGVRGLVEHGPAQVDSGCRESTNATVHQLPKPPNGDDERLAGHRRHGLQASRQAG